MNILFPAFLIDQREYQTSVNLWQEVCDEVLKKYHQSEHWNYDQYEVTPHTGQVQLRGNPIYWLINVQQKKGVRIIQLDPSIPTRWPVSAYTDLAGDEYLPYGTRNELVYSCQLTPEAVEKFKLLFEAWIQPICSIEQMNKMIDATIQ